MGAVLWAKALSHKATRSTAKRCAALPCQSTLAPSTLPVEKQAREGSEWSLWKGLASHWGVSVT
eukprot:7982771-Alexandrium_andersonii.AAC.1